LFRQISSAAYSDAAFSFSKGAKIANALTEPFSVENSSLKHIVKPIYASW
jgi:hypothetical protein